MVTAAVAYRELPANEKTKVNTLLEHHPDVERWDADRVRYGSTLDPGEYRFLRAAKWPDEIKGERGWPNRSSWHFANFGVTGPDSAIGDDPGARHDILVGLRESEETLWDRRTSPADRAIALSFVIHLLGDLHQPLHCATAITPAHPWPKGDEGGNTTMIRIDGHSPIRLHAFWDDLSGTSKDPDDADRQALVLLSRISASTGNSDGTDADWARESWRLAQSVAYPAGTWTAHGDEPITVDETYINRAKSTGEIQMVVAGVRLASVLRLETGRRTFWGCACGSDASPDVAVFAALLFLARLAHRRVGTLARRRSRSTS
jgi:hypothetical protein